MKKIKLIICVLLVVALNFVCLSAKSIAKTNDNKNQFNQKPAKTEQNKSETSKEKANPFIKKTSLLDAKDNNINLS